MSKNLRDDEGGVLVFVILMLPALVALAGLAYDGGMLFHARRETVNVAAAAARAGAADIDEAAYTYDQSLRLSGTAPDTARAFAESLGVTFVSAAMENGTDRAQSLTVVVSREVDFVFLDFVDSQTVTGTATARPVNE